MATITGRLSCQHGYIGVHWEAPDQVEGIGGRWFIPADEDVKQAAAGAIGREVELAFREDNGAEHATATAITRI